MVTPEKNANLIGEPTRAANIPRSELPGIMGQVERLKATLWSQLVRTPEPKTTQPEPPMVKTDQLLTADEAAEWLAVTRRWMYRRADSLPFTRRIGKRTLRFSANGIAQWLESRK
jgi:predicted DNA-binding transcriptional regulator AlpA